MFTTVDFGSNLTDWLPIVDTIINIVGMILIPIVIIYITRRIQAKEQSHNDKMNLFKVLMTNRNLRWSKESVHALNMIDIIFSDNPNVRIAWKNYYEALCIQNPNDEQMVDIDNAKYELLNEMATALGYKEDILWDAVQKPYLPQGMVNAMSQQEQFQTGMNKVIMGLLINQGQPMMSQQPNAEQTMNDAGREHHADAELDREG